MTDVIAGVVGGRPDLDDYFRGPPAVIAAARAELARLGLASEGIHAKRFIPTV